MRTLYRAFCSCNHWRYKDVDEQTVFFETFHTEDAGERLRALLANMWCVPESSVIVYNVYSEKELRLNSMDNSPVSGDEKLFEAGWSSEKQQPVYINQEGWPLMLVSPRTHERLVKAFMSISQIGRGEMKEAAHG
ncbi:hypothetical protein [Pectobacterium peruviense]|uniref:Uncharacterized protein n=1 Tax=Pectobacterium peruviense TaxID=2066479 RepID=A0ABX4S942_9GAMM|nr:hypothetical protein [Pectobacterium peruviense]PKX82753.1 hypothetical protein A0G02_13525 [Pectobacterium peruviense]PKX87082.1 hypothetical protein A0G03_06430 [Pectobacterium peruviense]